MGYIRPEPVWLRASCRNQDAIERELMQIDVTAKVLIDMGTTHEGVVLM